MASIAQTYEKQFNMNRIMHINRFCLRSFAIALMLIFPLLPGLGTESHAASILDDFSYGSTDEARRSWTARNNTPEVAIPVSGKGLRFPIPFEDDIDRAYWDRAVSMDLSGYDAISLDLSCANPEKMRSLAVYFKSGDGWYIWSRPLSSSGRQSIRMFKTDFSTEGNPAGWHSIETIRISPWKGTPGNTELTIYSMAAYNTSIFLLQWDGTEPDNTEQAVAKRTTRRISDWLRGMNISHGVITDGRLTPGIVERAKLIILGYSPVLSSRQRELLKTFIDNGGKLMVFYSSDTELASMMNLRLGNYLQAQGRGRWSSFLFEDPEEWMVPERIHQESWNIRPAYPVGENSRVIAHWENVHLDRSSKPAWTASAHGLWMSHILLQGDDENKRHMLTGLIGRYVPEIWRDVAASEIEKAGKIDSFSDFDHAKSAISRRAAGTRESRTVKRLLNNASEQHFLMQNMFDSGRYPEVVATGRKMNKQLVEAYARAQKPKTPELRGVWDHSGVGLYPGDWDSTLDLLANHGINAIFPNMLWGGVAHYDSRVLPRSDTFRLYGDQIDQCISAAKSHGLEVHIWAVCWNLTGAPADFVGKMRETGRLQVNSSGETIPWLNPAHPENRKLLIDSLMEIADRYPIHGIHLDYIRYPGANSCYSNYSRKMFEEWLGRSASGWPRSAQPGGQLAEQYRKFRVDQINLTVRGIKRQVGGKHPDLKISAAVFGGYPDTIDSIGQDWASWIKRGEVDFVTPMNYTSNPNKFSTLTRNQINLPGARGKILPGLGVTSTESQLTAGMVIEQILIARNLESPGFLLFDLNATLTNEILPMLKLGVTRDRSGTGH